MGEISNTLNIEADIEGNDAINAEVDTTILLRAFTNEGGMTMCILLYNAVGREGRRDVLYVRQESKPRRKVRGKGNGLSLYGALLIQRRHNMCEGM